MALDVEIGKYKQEYLNKMKINLEYLDNYFNKSKENPSVGIVICIDDDTEDVEYLYNRDLSASLFVKYDSALLDKELLLNKLKQYKKLL